MVKAKAMTVGFEEANRRGEDEDEDEGDEGGICKIDFVTLQWIAVGSR